MLSLFQDVKLKNMGSWSSLANISLAGEKTSVKKGQAKNSFEQFKKQAKEKEERVSNKDLAGV